MNIEICVDSVEGARAAERGGADRVELCANLLEGGTTPSAGCAVTTRRSVRIPVHVLIRPRGGDFLYSDSELEVMSEDIRMAKGWGIDGIVVGSLTSAGDIDVSRIRKLIGLARPLSVTFHRAFDMCRDPRRALEELIGLGVDRVLTSGQEASALKGVELIANLQRRAGDRIIVMPGGGINAENARQIVEATGVRELHLSARGPVESKMEFRNPRCSMGSALPPSEYRWRTTDEQAVDAVVRAVRASGPQS